MFAQPHAQRNVLIGRRVVAVGVHTPSEQLAADRIALIPQAMHGHIVLGAYPAVTVAIEQHFACDVRPVGTGGVPQPPIEEDGSARLCQHRYRPFRLAYAPAWKSQRVAKVASGDDPEVTAAGLV